MFMPEKGDEVLVAFEHGDPERPYIVGALWNGVDTAPRQGFWEDAGVEAVAAQSGGDSQSIQIPSDVANNDIKRIVTKSGHRIQFVDVNGQESLVVATGGLEQKIQLLNKCPETQRPMLCLDSPGDIYIHAGGRVHIRCQYFSREVG